ncbi:MAG: GNAT family N-acetyltransferase [Myxococcota bacterium]|nr:GNAT family N-acetyltransferase [Myxococcota bacterium]
MSDSKRYPIDRPQSHELPEFARIEREAASRFSDLDLPKGLRDSALSQGDLAAAAADGHVWVARDQTEKQVVGFAVVQPLDRGMHLRELDVLSQYGQEGIGRRLLRTVIEWSRDAGFSCLTLTTFKGVPWNAPFYLSEGFRAITQNEMGPDWQALWDQEVEKGFNPARRVALIKPLTDAQSVDE